MFQNNDLSGSILKFFTKRADFMYQESHLRTEGEQYNVVMLNMLKANSANQANQNESRVCETLVDC